ncbi:MAG: hypothetical protein ACTJHU_06245 [Mycetocola sp.]
MKTTALSSIAAAALLLGLVGCSSTGSDPKESTAPSAVADAAADASAEGTELDGQGEAIQPAPDDSLRTTAAVADGYPPEWVARNIPAVGGLSVDGEALENGTLLRVVGTTDVTDEIITGFTDELTAFGWSEVTPGVQYMYDTGSDMNLTIERDADGSATVTVEDLTVY